MKSFVAALLFCSLLSAQTEPGAEKIHKPPKTSAPKQQPCSMAGNFVICGDHITTWSEQEAILTGHTPTAEVPRDANGRIKRSPEARAEFKRQRPCPANGDSKGACPGYIIDHVVPLACGGADAPSNMQWQTTDDAKAKDRWERKTCGKSD